jgi:hypothetical protein
MDPALSDLLKRQQRDGFPDLAGTQFAATIPVSEGLINALIAALVPNGGKVREIRVRLSENDRLTAELRVSGPAFLPAIPVRLAIEDQPELPERPTLGLKLVESSGLVARAASLLPTLALPPGIAIEGDRIRIDVRRLLAERNLEGWLEYVTDLRINTRTEAVVLYVRARIRPSG